MPTQTTRKHRRALAGLLIAALLAAGVWLLIGQAASFARLAHALRRATLWWLVAAAVGVPALYVGYAALYRAVTGACGGPRPGRRLALRITVAVFGVSILATAAGRLGGEYWTLRRMHEEPPQAWTRVLALNIAEWGVLALMAWLGAVLMLVGDAGTAPLGVELAWLLVLPVCVAGAFFFTSGTRRRLAEDCGRSWRRTFAAALRAIVLLRRIGADRPHLIRASAAGLLHWGGDVLIVWAALRAFGVELGVVPVVVGFATGYAATMLPLPAGGAGGIEAAATYALTLVGVPLGPALLATLVQRLCTYWLPLAVALVGARSVKRLGGELASVGRAPGDAA